MALSLPQLPGPAYWNRTFGLGDYGAFEGVTESILGNATNIVPSWLSHAAILGAYEDPATALGVYVSAYLTASQVGTTSFFQQALGLATPLADPTLKGNQAVTTLIIPAAFQVSINYTAGGKTMANVIGVTNSSGTAAGAAAAVKAAWEAGTGPISQWSNSIAMTGYTAVDLSSTHGSIATLASSAIGGQTGTNQFSTRAASALIQWNGSVRARSTRGRLYFGPLMEQQINPDGATMVAGFQTSIAAAFTAFRSSLSSAGYPLAVLSRKDLAAYAVSASTVETTIATQRRRIRS